MIITRTRGRGARPHGTKPHGTIFSFVAPPAAAIDTSKIKPFFVAEVSAAKPGVATITYDQGHGAHGHGTLAQFADAPPASGVLYVSDGGYRTRDADPLGVVAYPPKLSDAFQVSRAVSLPPGESALAAAWGSLVLDNSAGDYDTVAATWNNDGRPLVIMAGNKSLDTTRYVWTDPAYSSLTDMFRGISTPWILGEMTLQVPLRDATYWLERPVQTVVYDGSGTYGGSSNLAGKPKPKMRGACYGVTPVLIDPTYLIYQYTDGPGTVSALYEGWKATYTNAGDTTNLYSGTTPAGQYRTDNSRGLFQLGSAPTYSITVNASGSFPVAGAKTNPADIARYLLSEDLALPPANLDTSNFAATATTLSGWTAGVYFSPDDNPQGVAALETILAAMGAKLIPRRNGTLSLYLLRALSGAETPVLEITTANAVSLAPRSLPASLSPPPYRVRVGYQHNYTVQTSGLNPTAATSDQQFAAAPDRYGYWFDSTLLTKYAHPNDLAPVRTGLTQQTHATTLANSWGALWGTARGFYDVVLPVAAGLGLDIGSVVRLTWPTAGLRSGVVGQIVGDSFHSTDATITVQVLV